MKQFYPKLTAEDLAKSLPPLELGEDKIMTWMLGGHTKSLSAQGYLGSPADYETVAVTKHLEDTAERITVGILNKYIL